MEKRRSVDKAQKWCNLAISDDRLVPSMAAEIVAEIEAHTEYEGELNITISHKSSEIRELEAENFTLTATLGERDDKIARMREVVESLGLKARVLRLLKEEF